MLSARDVARYFLAITDEDSGEYISHLKLQKLCYYAQGFHLALFDTPLFPERIEAWQHGPVIPDLWYQYQKYGPFIIQKPDDLDFSIYDDDTRIFLDEVYAIYGQFSAWKLRDMTHEEPPWSAAWNSPNKTITHDALKRYFVTLTEEP